MYIGYFLLFVWYVFVIIQSFMSYGTAYRSTKAGGDNGVALFGWFIVYGLASLIPGLGIYFWKKLKNEEISYSIRRNNYSRPVYSDKKCRQCGTIFSGTFCPNCGSSLYEEVNNSSGFNQPYQGAGVCPRCVYSTLFTTHRYFSFISLELIPAPSLMMNFSSSASSQP